jgi:hypothetical protein
MKPRGAAESEAKLNAVVEAVRHIIPGAFLESVIRKGRLVL